MTAANHPPNERYINLIRHHPLFRGVDDTLFEQLIAHCQLLSYDKQEMVLHSKTERESLLLILEGSVEVFVSGPTAAKEEVLEILQAGDLIGLSSIAHFLGEPPHVNSQHNVGVRSIEPTHCLEIPFHVLEKRWPDEEVRHYLLRQLAVRLKDVYASLAEQLYLAQRWGESEPFVRRVHDLMSSPVIAVEVTDTIAHAAREMMNHQVSSVVVMDKGRLAGIITKSDLVRQMAAEHQVQGSTVGLWMSPNPLTITSDSYYYQALAIFLTENIKHLPVTKNGRVIGMLTLADLMRKKNRGLFDSIQAIEKAEASQLSQIKEGIYLVFASLLQDGLPAIHITDVLTTLYDRLVQHCLRLAESDLENEGLGEPPVPYCWFHMGSSGRKEQFLLTDQDHFLVYQDLEHLTKEEQEKTRQYFAQLTRAVVGYLEQAGFSRCQGGMMATNPAWRGSLSYWQQVLRKWTLHTTNTTLIKAHNFLSFRLVQGDQQLYEQFLALVKQELKRSSVFLYRMAALEREQSVPALHHPIRAFFRLAKKEIDLKKEALFPFHHALHILALSHGVYEGTPVEKIEQLVRKKVLDASFGEALLDAYSSVLRIRMAHAWQQYEQGEEMTSALSLSELNYREKEDLRRALYTIRSLQQQMLIHFGM